MVNAIEKRQQSTDTLNSVACKFTKKEQLPWCSININNMAVTIRYADRIDQPIAFFCVISAIPLVSIIVINSYSLTVQVYICIALVLILASIVNFSILYVRSTSITIDNSKILIGILDKQAEVLLCLSFGAFFSLGPILLVDLEESAKEVLRYYVLVALGLFISGVYNLAHEKPKIIMDRKDTTVSFYDIGIRIYLSLECDKKGIFYVTFYRRKMNALVAYLESIGAVRPNSSNQDSGDLNNLAYPVFIYVPAGAAQSLRLLKEKAPSTRGRSGSSGALR